MTLPFFSLFQSPCQPVFSVLSASNFSGLLLCLPVLSLFLHSYPAFSLRYCPTSYWPSSFFKITFLPCCYEDAFTSWCSVLQMHLSRLWTGQPVSRCITMHYQCLFYLLATPQQTVCIAAGTFHALMFCDVSGCSCWTDLPQAIRPRVTHVSSCNTKPSQITQA